MEILKRDEKVPKFIGWDANGLGYITVPNGEPKSPSSPFKKVLSYQPIFDDDAETLDLFFIRVADLDGKSRLINCLTGELV